MFQLFDRRVQIPLAKKDWDYFSQEIKRGRSREINIRTAGHE